MTGGSWQVGKEVIFQYESDPASGWLVPDQTKLYCRFKVSAAGATDGVIPSKAIRLAACPLLGLFDGARWSMNGTTVQSVAGDIDTIGQLQLRMRGSRESHDTNGSLGADSLRQHITTVDLVALDALARHTRFCNNMHVALFQQATTNRGSVSMYDKARWYARVSFSS